MKSFDFNGRNYKVVNGLAHTVENSIHDSIMVTPCYQGDNVMLDAYCDILGVKLYQRSN